MTPREVDDTGILDLLVLSFGIDARRRMREKGAEGGVWIA